MWLPTSALQATYADDVLLQVAVASSGESQRTWDTKDYSFTQVFCDFHPILVL